MIVHRCPGDGDCHGQFFVLRNYGIVCTYWLSQLSEDERRFFYELAVRRRFITTLVLIEQGAGL